MSNTMTRVMRKQVRVTQGKHQGEPTCDNCLWMTIIKTGSGNHRHCDLMGLYIPDDGGFPAQVVSCLLARGFVLPGV